VSPKIGELVPHGVAPRPERITLPGRYVSLTPLDPARHGSDLYRGTTDERLWDYMGDGPYADESSFQASLVKKAASEDPLFYAIVNDRNALGYLSLLRIEPAHGVIEVGHIMYSSGLQRTRGATEAIYLLARYVFDELGYRRFEWKCNSFNEPSRRAALRYGFQFEGIFRQHMIIKGRNRDTAWFAMIDKDWPARKAAFERWLAPGNFDSEGKQLQPLDRI
jgi:RimJ/RimL family protein N-acetyltransferase